MLYNIFDITKSIWDDDFVVEAKSAREALQTYLSSKGKKDTKFHITADRDSTWITTPINLVGTHKYKAGKTLQWKQGEIHKI